MLVSKYTTQRAQLISISSLSAFGEPAATSISTIYCLVYQEALDLKQQASLQRTTMEHYALIPSSVSINVGDELRTVVTSTGAAVLSAARVAELVEYTHWRSGPRLKVVRLEVL